MKPTVAPTTDLRALEARRERRVLLRAIMDCNLGAEMHRQKRYDEAQSHYDNSMRLLSPLNERAHYARDRYSETEWDFFLGYQSEISQVTNVQNTHEPLVFHPIMNGTTLDELVDLGAFSSEFATMVALYNTFVLAAQTKRDRAISLTLSEVIISYVEGFRWQDAMFQGPRLSFVPFVHPSFFLSFEYFRVVALIDLQLMEEAMMITQANMVNGLQEPTVARNHHVHASLWSIYAYLTFIFGDPDFGFDCYFCASIHYNAMRDSIPDEDDGRSHAPCA